MTSKEILLIVVPWNPPEAWLAEIAKINPALQVEFRSQTMYGTALPDNITPEEWKRVAILLTWKTFPPKELVPNLRYVQLLSAGCNQILDLPLFKDTDVAFCTASGIHPPQMTEWVFCTFLAFQHHIPIHLENQKVGNWVEPVTDEDTEDAVGLRVGILGYGAIGRQVARVAKAFGMDVYAYTLHERATPASRRDETYSEPGLGDAAGEFPSKWFFGADQLEAFLGSDLDLLVITLPLTSATKGMIGPSQFQLLSKKKAFLSNVGRGPIVDTDALMQALDQGLIRGAALDVTDPEPLPKEHKLWTYPNVIITPHDSGNSLAYYDRVRKIFLYNLQRLTEGKELTNKVNKKLQY